MILEKLGVFDNGREGPEPEWIKQAVNNELEMTQ